MILMSYLSIFLIRLYTIKKLRMVFYIFLILSILYSKIAVFTFFHYNGFHILTLLKKEEVLNFLNEIV